MTCKQCKSPLTFETLSDLRRHQWAAHGEMYRTAIERNRKKRGGKLVSQMSPVYRERQKFKCKTCNHVSKGQRAMLRHAWTHRELFTNRRGKSKELVPAVRLERINGIPEAHKVLNQEMTAFELLQKINGQKDFITNVSKLIEGMLMK